jgi:hypothetical protein
MIFNIKEEHKPQSSVALDALYYPHSTETEYNPKFYHISSQKYTYFIFFMIRHISMKLEPICERNAATIKSQNVSNYQEFGTLQQVTMIQEENSSF